MTYYLAVNPKQINIPEYLDILDNGNVVYDYRKGEIKVKVGSECILYNIHDKMAVMRVRVLDVVFLGLILQKIKRLNYPVHTRLLCGNNLGSSIKIKLPQGESFWYDYDHYNWMRDNYDRIFGRLILSRMESLNHWVPGEEFEE